MLEHMTAEKDIVGPLQERMIFPALNLDRLQVDVAVAKSIQNLPDLLADNRILLDTEETGIGRAVAIEGSCAEAIIEDVFLCESYPRQAQNSQRQQHFTHSHVCRMVKNILTVSVNRLKYFLRFHRGVIIQLAHLVSIRRLSLNR